MGVYATENTKLGNQLTRAQYEYDCVDGSNSVSIKVYENRTDDAQIRHQLGHYYPDTQSGNDSLQYEWTGTGGFDQLVADWRAANGSVSSGVMFDIWQDVTNSSTSDKNTAKADLQTHITYLTRKKAHYQAIVDNGEDPSGLTLEDMATIEALKS